MSCQLTFYLTFPGVDTCFRKLQVEQSRIASRPFPFCWIPRKAVSFPLFGSRLRVTAGKHVDFSHAAVWFCLVGPQGRRFSQIPQRISILPGALALLRESDGYGVEQVRGPGILRIEL